MKRELLLIDIESIKPNPFQPRSKFDEESINELSDSIKTHGLIQPIIVRRQNDQYQLISGERRLKASKQAGAGQIPAVIVDIDGVEVAEVSLIENLHRKNLNCIEEAVAFSILKKQFGMTQDEIATRIGKSRPYVTNTLRLLDLPDETRNLLIEGTITAGHGRALLGLPTEDLIREVVLQVLREALSVRQTEKLVQDILSGEKIKPPQKRSVTKYFKDARIYYNAIKKVLKEIKLAGGKADLIERETEDYLEILLRIPKGDTMITEGLSIEMDKAQGTPSRQ
jgi:ParB family transcriptional regulator, chromosome partitioning protein